MIVEFDSKKANTTSPHYLSSAVDEDSWRVTLIDGLNEVSEDLVGKLKQHDSIDYYLKRGAIVFREEAQTVFQRRAELEAIYEAQGYRPIADLATSYNIAKPQAGWKDAIELIIAYEASMTENA